MAFYSQQLTGPEWNYDIHNQELLAIVTAFDKWRHYLQEAKYEIVIKSDHHNLKYFTTTKRLVGQQIQLAEELSRFNFQIEHIKGKENTIVNVLSQQPDYRVEIESPETNILEETEEGL